MRGQGDSGLNGKEDANRLAPARPGRRRFLTDTAKIGGAVALAGLGLGIHARKAVSLPMQALRPPGARVEDDFLGTCVRCGLCVRACPYDTLKLATLGEGVAVGTPYFTAREVPCEMCDDIPCVAACPTGALDPGLTDIDDARMGLAALINQETCLNFLGLRCDVCYRQCPAIDQAITLEMRHNTRSGKHTLFLPTVHSEACTGCGKCEHVCVLPEAAIKVMPLSVAKGQSAAYYRRGWEEKERAGHSLVSPDPEHRYNLPEGMDYDYEGKGLIDGAQPPPEAPAEPLAEPFPEDPLQSLNGSPEGPP